MYLRNCSIILISLSLLIAGCKNDDDSDSTVPGAIKGKLNLADEFGNVLSDHSGVTITASNKTAVSETTGEYTIPGLASGKHNLSYEKQGYGTYIKYSIEVNGGGAVTQLNGVDYIGAISTTQISNLAITQNVPGSTYNISCSIFPVPIPASPRPFRLFFGKDSLVTSSDYDFAPSNTWLANSANGSILNYNPADLYNNGFSSGETVYLIAYGDSFYPNSYTDPATEKKVYPNVNSGAPSNVVSFILP